MAVSSLEETPGTGSLQKNRIKLCLNKFQASEKTPKSVLIEVYEEDIGKEDFMGKIAMDINELVYKQKLTDQWIPLSDCKSGEILISVETAPKSIDESEKVDMPTNQESEDDITTPISTIKETKVDVRISDEKVQHVGKVMSDKKESVTIEEEQPKEDVVIGEESLTEQPQTIQDDSTPSLPVAKYEPITGEYNIILTIMKAKNLQKEGLMGKPDPYVIVTY